MPATIYQPGGAQWSSAGGYQNLQFYPTQGYAAGSSTHTQPSWNWNQSYGVGSSRGPASPSPAHSQTVERSFFPTRSSRSRSRGPASPAQEYSHTERTFFPPRSGSSSPGGGPSTSLSLRIRSRSSSREREPLVNDLSLSLAPPDRQTRLKDHPC